MTVPLNAVGLELPQSTEYLLMHMCLQLCGHKGYLVLQVTEARSVFRFDLPTIQHDFVNVR